jgi:type I restriction enzyme S subunit
MTGPTAERLGDLTERVATWNPARSPDEQFDYIDLSSVDQNKKLVTGATRVLTNVAPSRARQLVSAGDVLVSTVRPNLNGVAVVPEDLEGATASTGFTVLRPGSRLDGRYLFHWVRTDQFIGAMVRNATGASYPAVSDKVINASLIPLPRLEDQRRIAAILDHADALRVKRRETLAHLDDLTQSIFLDMFGEEQTTPVMLGDHLTFVTSGGRGWAKYYAEQGCRFIRSLDVRMNSIRDTDSMYVKPPDNAEARRTAVKEGDVLLTITGSRIGRVSAVPARLGGAFVSQHVAILRPDHRTLRSEFLAFVLSLPMVGQRQIAGFQYGQTKPGLNFEQIRGFSLPVPSIVAQDEFRRRLTAAGELRIRGEHQESLVDDLFASLQARAFSGRL